MTEVEKDPWLDDEFAQPYSDPHGVALMDDLAEIEREDPAQFPVQLNPETVTNIPAPAAPEPVQVAEPVEPEEPAGPEVIELDGGGTLTIEKKGKKWCASLDAGAGGVQNFYGQNKNELLVAAFKAQANATRKIRDLNRQVKLGPVAAEPQAPKPAKPQSRELSADEVTEIALELKTNPDAALEKWLQKKTGMTSQQLSDLSRQVRDGTEAKQELTAEQVNKSFLQRNPDFFPDAKYENFSSLVEYLGKYKLGKTIPTRATGEAREALIDEFYHTLLEGGEWTVQNLEDAFNDLNTSGLLVSRPTPAPAPQPSAVAPAPPAAAQPRTDDRIVRTETRPRASLGIRTSEAQPAAPMPTPLSSADDPDNMTTEQLLSAIRREGQKLRTPRPR
jgi:hypothetical protein